MRTSPSVSVVIPCYNGARFLREALDSVRAQTHPPLEILVIDDGSTDDSAMIAESSGPPVRVIRQANQGESVARNRGIDEAQGEWIAFLDADDLWTTSRLSRVLAAAEPATCAVVNNIHFFGRDNYDAPRWVDSPDVMSSVEFVCDLHAFVPSTLIIRSTIGARFPEWTQHAEDYVFTLDVLACGPVSFVDEPLTHYRLHSSNQSGHPASLVRQDETIARWLRENAPRLGEERVRAIRRRQLELLVARARAARLARRWETFDAIAAYLQAHRTNDAVRQLLEERPLPRWLYTCIDTLDRIPMVQGMRRRLLP
jgi:glycosyltransferase involved in cell wall biosynthesis